VSGQSHPGLFVMGSTQNNSLGLGFATIGGPPSLNIAHWQSPTWGVPNTPWDCERAIPAWGSSSWGVLEPIAWGQESQKLGDPPPWTLPMGNPQMGNSATPAPFPPPPRIIMAWGLLETITWGQESEKLGDPLLGHCELAILRWGIRRRRPLSPLLLG